MNQKRNYQCPCWRERISFDIGKRNPITAISVRGTIDRVKVVRCQKCKRDDFVSRADVGFGELRSKDGGRREN